MSAPQLPIISRRDLPKGNDLKLRAFLDLWKKDLQKDAANTWDQRDAANEDMCFMYEDGGMWKDWYADDYGEGRVKPQVNLIAPHVNKFQGEWNGNRIGVEYRATDDKTSPKDAKLMNGVYRDGFRKFGGPEATDNAVLEQSVAGCGAFQFSTKFTDEEDPENENQEIIWEPIDSAFNTVIWDRTAKRLNKSDAKRVTRLYPYDRDDFLAIWPDASPSSVFDPRTWGAYNWNSYHNFSRDIIYVAKHYEVFKVREKVFVYTDLPTGEIEVYSEEEHKKKADDLESDSSKLFLRERTKIVRQVWSSLFTNDEFLEKPRRIVGKWLPIIPFYGYRAFVDSQEYYRGIVREAKDINRLFNMLIGKLAENSASAGTATKLFHPDQMEGPIGDNWVNVVNKPWLPVGEFKDSSGKVHVGPLGEIPPEQLDASTVMLLNQIPAMMQAINADMPQDMIDPNSSGKAINAMVKRMNMNTQPLMDNIANAIEWSGVVYQSMAAEIFSEKRVVNTLGKDGAEGVVKIRESITDEETGRMIEDNDLRGKKFQAYADTGEQFETNREQNVETIKDILQLPVMQTPAGEKYLAPLLDSLFQNVGGDGLEPINKISRNSLIMQGLMDPETDEEKKMVQDIKNQQQQPKAQDKLMESVTNQQNAEARSLDASAQDKAAAAKLKGAQVLKVFSDIEVDQSQKKNDSAKTAADIKNEQNKTLIALEKQNREALEKLPVG